MKTSKPWATDMLMDLEVKVDAGAREDGPALVDNAWFLWSQSRLADPRKAAFSRAFVLIRKAIREGYCDT